MLVLVLLKTRTIIEWGYRLLVSGIYKHKILECRIGKLKRLEIVQVKVEYFTIFLCTFGFYVLVAFLNFLVIVL